LETDKKLSAQHLKKTLACEEHGYKLLHIFENEWKAKRTIWESMISNMLGLSRRIYARKTTVKVITVQEARQFFNDTHMQGYVKSSLYIGLYFGEDLVSCASFGKPRFSKGDFEILRFSNALNTVVVGGFSKIMKYFERTHSGTLISYANRRWSIGGVYERNGFEKVSTSRPNYFYWDGKTPLVLQSRNKFQKHKLKKELDLFDPELTESQNMYLNGYRRIWDCGNILYKKKLEGKNS
jgi:hypothetical protein